MQLIIIFWVIGLFSVIIGFFSFVYLKNKKPLADEVGKNLLFTKVVSAQVGTFKVSIPMGRISFYEEFFVVKALETIVIKKGQIENVSKDLLGFGAFIKIVSKEFPNLNIRIWGPGNDLIMEKIKSYL